MDGIRVRGARLVYRSPSADTEPYGIGRFLDGDIIEFPKAAQIAGASPGRGPVIIEATGHYFQLGHANASRTRELVTMNDTQKDHDHCPACGGRRIILPIISLWEFEAVCPACQQRGLISWSHESPPPRYLASVPTVRLPLFEEDLP